MLFSDIVYRINKATGIAGSTYYIDTISRVPVKVRNYSGDFVRYGGAFRRLYPAKNFRALVLKAKRSGAIVVVNGENYRPSKHEPRNFMLTYEKSIGAYYDPTMRWP